MTLIEAQTVGSTVTIAAMTAKTTGKPRAWQQKLAEAMTSPQVREFLVENFDETAIPAFE